MQIEDHLNVGAKHGCIPMSRHFYRPDQSIEMLHLPSKTDSIFTKRMIVTIIDIEVVGLVEAK